MGDGSGGGGEWAEGLDGGRGNGLHCDTLMRK